MVNTTKTSPTKNTVNGNEWFDKLNNLVVKFVDDSDPIAKQEFVTLWKEKNRRDGYDVDQLTDAEVFELFYGGKVPELKTESIQEGSQSTTLEECDCDKSSLLNLKPFVIQIDTDDENAEGEETEHDDENQTEEPESSSEDDLSITVSPIKTPENNSNDGDNDNINPTVTPKFLEAVSERDADLETVEVAVEGEGNKPEEEIVVEKEDDKNKPDEEEMDENKKASKEGYTVSTLPPSDKDLEKK